MRLSYQHTQLRVEVDSNLACIKKESLAVSLKTHHSSFTLYNHMYHEATGSVQPWQLPGYAR